MFDIKRTQCGYTQIPPYNTQVALLSQQTNNCKIANAGGRVLFRMKVHHHVDDQAQIRFLNTPENPITESILIIGEILQKINHARVEQTTQDHIVCEKNKLIQRDINRKTITRGKSDTG
jgi:hypothetical protein